MSQLSVSLLESLLSMRSPEQPTAERIFARGREPAPSHASGSEGRPRLAPIIAACDFMRHWAVNAADLTEPEWKAGIDIAVRCDDGEEAIHHYSATYPRYNEVETNEKIRRAREGPPPRTCSNIAYEIAFSGCLHCPFFKD